MEEFKSPYCLAFLSGLFGVLVSYIDNKVNNQNRTMNDYLKIFILVSLVSLVSLVVMESFDKNNVANLVGGSKSLGTASSQDIFTGNPDF